MQLSKMIILIIVVQLAFSLADATYTNVIVPREQTNSSNEFSYPLLDIYANRSESSLDDLKASEANADSEQWDVTFGDTKGWGAVLWDVISYPFNGFWNQFNSGNQQQSQIEELIWRAISLIRMILYTVLVIQIYAFIKNKQGS